MDIEEMLYVGEANMPDGSVVPGIMYNPAAEVLHAATIREAMELASGRGLFHLLVSPVFYAEIITHPEACDSTDLNHCKWVGLTFDGKITWNRRLVAYDRSSVKMVYCDLSRGECIVGAKYNGAISHPVMDAARMVYIECDAGIL